MVKLFDLSTHSWIRIVGFLLTSLFLFWAVGSIFLAALIYCLIEFLQVVYACLQRYFIDEQKSQDLFYFFV